MPNCKEQPNLTGFFVRELEAGCFSVRLNLALLVEHIDLIREFHRWMMTRSSRDRVYLYLEGGSANSLWLSDGGYLLRNVADLIKAIELSPAYPNIVLLITQMLTGAASYVILATNRVKWGPLGAVSFDGWLSGKDVSDYDQGVRPLITWIKSYFEKGTALKLLTEEDIEDHAAGKTVILRSKAVQ